MRLFLGLLAVSLVGADRPKAAELPMVTYQFRLVEMDGPGWRNACYAQLQPVARQGDAVIWTAPRSVAQEVVAKSRRVEAAPRLTAYSDERATIVNRSNRAFVAGYLPREDSTVRVVAWSASTPSIETASSGWSMSVTGRKLDQGMLVKVEMSDDYLVAMHNVAVAPTPSATTPLTAKADAMTIQVPEVDRTKLEGEWLVPKDQVLLVSLGLKTSASSEGKAVVTERLAMLEAVPTPAMSNVMGLKSIPLPSPLPRLSNANSTPQVGTPAIPAPMAIAPSRGLPMPLSATGEEVKLPPLPEEVTPPPTTKDGSAEPCATPQAKAVPSGEPIPVKPSQLRDTKAKQAGFDPDSGCCEEMPDCEETARPSVKATAPKAFTLRLPQWTGFEVEIHASFSAPSAASVPPPPVIPGLKAN